MYKIETNKIDYEPLAKINIITFFTQLYHPDMTTTAMIMQDIAEDLCSHGFKINVVCAQPTYLSKKKNPNRENLNNVSIRRVLTFRLDKNRISGRLLNSISCFLSMLTVLPAYRKSRLLVFNTNPALLPLLGFAARILFGSRYIVLIHDLWPELPAHTGLIQKNGAIYKLIDFLNIHSLKRADSIIVLSKKMKTLVIKKTSLPEHKVHLIPNWTDTRRVYPVPPAHNNLMNQLNLANRKIVMYSGNIGLYQPMEVMIEAANELKDLDDVVFVFTGDGGKKKKIQTMAKKMNLSNVRFFSFQPVERLAESLSMADISLLGIYPDNEGVIMPSKLYGLLAVGKPIISVSAPESEIAETLKEAKAGIQSPIDSPKALADNIRFILNNPETAKTFGQNGRRYFLEHFERKILTKKWKDTLDMILSSN